MEVSAEKLAEVDRQLDELGRSEDEIDAVLARFEGREPPGLEEVDAELAALEAELEGMEELLARVRDGVGSALSEAREPEPGAGEATGEPVPEATAEAAPESFSEDLPTAESEPPPAVTEEAAQASAALDQALAEESSLDAADLFGDAPSEAPGSDDEVEAQAEADFAALFGDEQGGVAASEGAVDLADSLEGEVIASQPSTPAETGYEEEPEDSTSVFTSEDIQAIRADASQPPPRPASSAPPPRDPEIDALLGDDEAVFRPSSPPPTAEAQPVPDSASSGEFELLVDEDIMLIDDDEDEDFPEEGPTRAEASPFVPDQEEPTVAEAAPAEGEEQAEEGEKKGFFKKLFGND